VLAGILSALGVANLYSLSLSLSTGQAPSFKALVVFPLWAVLMTSCFVAPIGAALGLIVPRCFRNCGRWSSILGGSALGAVVGLIIAVLTVIWEYWPVMFGDGNLLGDPARFRAHFLVRLVHYASGMSPITALWIGLWSMQCSRSPKLNEPR
jgi:hypothetical protein